MEPCQVDPHLEQSQYALDLVETVLNHAFDRMYVMGHALH